MMTWVQNNRRASHRIGGLAAALLICCVAAAPGSLLEESFDGPNGTLPTDWEAADSAVMVSRLDGNELEQEAVAGGDGDAFAAYINDDDTDRGVWRDVDVVTTLRFNSPVNNGLVLRGQGSSAADVKSDDFYLVQIVNGQLRLYRSLNGSFSGPLDSGDGTSFSTTDDRELRVQIANIANPDTDRVRIQAQLMSSDGLSVVQSFDYTDTSSSAITRAGTVGLRASVTDDSGLRATYDDLSVATSNPDLLWYDDYYDNAAPRMQSFTSGATQGVSGTKFQFASIGSGGEGRAVVDFDSHTSTEQWENVRATTLTRWATNNDGGRLETGLILRETGMTASDDGDYYYFGLIRNEGANAFAARIFRVIDGVRSQIASTPIFNSDVFPESTNLFVSFKAITNALGNVELEGLASLNADFSDPITILSTIDTNAARILGPGSAGLSASGSSVGGAIVNYDNFTVQFIPEPASLLVLAGMGLGMFRRRRRL